MKPVVIGGAMGAMLPFVLHGQGWLGAATLVGAHFLIVGSAIALCLCVPGLRRRLANHLPGVGHVLGMGCVGVIGFAAICMACLASSGMDHLWI